MSKELERNEVEQKYKWDLEKIYRNEDEITISINEIKTLTKELLEYKDHIMDSSNNLLKVITLEYSISRITDNLIVYSNMKHHEEMSVSKNQVLVEKIDKFLNDIGEQLAFVEPELLKYDYKEIEKFYDEEPKLKEYAFSLEKVFRDKPYTLSLKEEEMMARLGKIFNNSSDTFEMLDVVDLKFDDIKDKNNNTLSLTQSSFSTYLRSSDRTLRKNAFNSFYKSYIEHKNTFASTLYGDIKTNFFVSKTRGYKNPLYMSLYGDNISEDLYNSLIEKVHNHLNISYDYIKLKKKVLNVDELHMYDIYAPLVENVEKKYTYEEAINLVKESLSVLGEDYLKDLTNIIENNCIDVYHNKNKQTGAYSWGSYDTLPYVLLNFEGTFNDVSTIAHELGHSMHSYYSHKNNTYEDSNYTIFLAEIASTVNEMLLNRYCSLHAKSKKEKMFYLNSLLESIRTTLIRQTMFAEFEKILYDLEEKGEVLTEEIISDTYYDLNKKYYGKDIVSDKEIRLEWARISHFYNSFYVYKYATGITIAIRIVEDILSGKENALDNYLSFLKSGGNDYSLNILKKVGIDIVNDDTIDKALKLFEKTIKEFEECL